MSCRVVPISTELTPDFLQSDYSLHPRRARLSTFEVYQSLYGHILRNSKNRSPTMSSSTAPASTKNDAESLRCSRILSSKLYLDIPTSKVNLYTNYLILGVSILLLDFWFSWC